MEVSTVVKKISQEKMVKMFKFWSLWRMNSLLLLLVLLLLVSTLASGDGSKNRTRFWQALNGNKYSRLSKDEIPKFMLPVDDKGVALLTGPQDLPPAQAPKPVPTETNVVEQPLPSVVPKTSQSRPKSISSAPPPKPNWQSIYSPHSLKILVIMVIIMAALFATLFICAILWKILVFVSR